MKKYGKEYQQFHDWLKEDDLLGKFREYDHATVALPIEEKPVKLLNDGVRSTKGCWYPNNGDWNDDDWIIGEDGAGNYYTISKSGAYEGVYVYYHDCLQIEPYHVSLKAFYDDCIQIYNESN